MAARGTAGFLITTPTKGLLARNAKRESIMRAFVLMAAVLTSAMLTVPTVTQAAESKVSELRLDA